MGVRARDGRPEEDEQKSLAGVCSALGRFDVLLGGHLFERSNVVPATLVYIAISTCRCVTTSNVRLAQNGFHDKAHLSRGFPSRGPGQVSLLHAKPSQPRPQLRVCCGGPLCPRPCGTPAISPSATQGGVRSPRRIRRNSMLRELPVECLSSELPRGETIPLLPSNLDNAAL